VVCGAWCVVCDVYDVTAVWCVPYGVWCEVRGVWCVVCGVWCVVCLVSFMSCHGVESRVGRNLCSTNAYMWHDVFMCGITR